MSPAKTDRREPNATTTTVEPSSWWPFVAIVLGALGSYSLLIVHLLLEATHASGWGLAWMVVPGLLFGGSVAALLIASGMPVREKLAMIPAGLLGYSPRVRSQRQTDARLREPA
jgi:hypothetical protein